MASLALRNLIHDKVRLGVTLTGIIFSVVLTGVQLGLFVGFQVATSDIIDHSQADIWVTSKNLTNIEDGVPFSERKLYQVLAVEGVERVTKQIVQFGNWKRPNGADTGIMLVGFDPNSSLGGPWNIVAGRLEDLDQPDAVFVDELYSEKLGVRQVGETVEIRGRKARVVGFTRGIRTFTTSPAVFASFKNAQDYFGLREDQTLFLLVKAAPNSDVQKLKQDILASVKDVDVHTREELSRKQRDYWMFGTGAGVTVLIAAALGLLVGVVIVAQTIYAATVDHIREYGTLKAMGATNGYIYRVIIKQATMSGVVGYAVGMCICLFAAYMSQQGTTAIIIPWQLVIGLFGLTMLMCVSASIVSINKATRIDPAMVFRG
jgi:putative ABC transport system permease protein